MKATLISQFYEHLPKPDQRLFRILMHTGSKEEELLVKELKRIHQDLDEKAYEEAMKGLDAITTIYSEEGPSKVTKDGRKHQSWAQRKNEQHRILLRLKDASVEEALRRLLKQVTTTSVFPVDDQFVLEALLYCYRRNDQATGEFPEADIRDLLINPDKIAMQKPEELKEVLSLLLRAYFGERETGSYLTRIFPGIVARESWINDFIDIHKSLYIHPLTHPLFSELEKVLLKICSNRMNESETMPLKSNIPLPRLFKEEHDEDITRLKQIFQVLGGDKKSQADSIQ